jgi:hypothetical protein
VQLGLLLVLSAGMELGRTFSLKANSMCPMCMSIIGIFSICNEVIAIGSLIFAFVMRQGQQQLLRACHVKQDTFQLSQVSLG